MVDLDKFKRVVLKYFYWNDIVIKLMFGFV